MSGYRGKVVDAHHHLWQGARKTIPWLADPANRELARDVGPDDLLAAAGSLDIVASVWIEALASDPFAEALAAAAVHCTAPRVNTAIIAHAPLDAPDIGDRLDRMADEVPGLRGIRDILAVRPGHSSFARRPDLLGSAAFAAGLAALAARGLVFDAMIEPWQMPEMIELARRYQALSIVIEHAGSPDFSSNEGTRIWCEAMRSAALVPNIAVKISALHCRMPDWTDARLAAPILDLVEWFGVGRLAFASDFPVHDRTIPFARAFETFADAVGGLSRDEQAALFHDTARRLYRI